MRTGRTTALAAALVLATGVIGVSRPIAEAQTGDAWDRVGDLVPPALAGECGPLEFEPGDATVPSIAHLVCLDSSGPEKIDDVGFFLFEDEDQLRRWWKKRTERIEADTGIPLASGDCRRNTQGFEQIPGGELICYKQSGNARVRWIDVDNLLYGSLDTYWGRIAWAFDWWTKNLSDDAVLTAEEAGTSGNQGAVGSESSPAGELSSETAEETGTERSLEGEEAGDPPESGTQVRRVPDRFQDAHVVDALPFVVSELDLTSATSQDDEPTDCGGMRRTAWFRYQPKEDVVVGLEVVATPIVRNNVESTISLYEGSKLQRLRQRACAYSWSQDDPKYVTAPLQGGQTYYIQVASDWGESSVVDLSISEHQPPNDFFQTATTLRLDRPFVDDEIDLTHATASEDAGLASCEGPDRTIWYRLKPGSDGRLEATVDGSVFASGDDVNSFVAVYRGAKLNRLRELHCAYDYDGAPLQVSIPVQAGETYMLQVGSVYGGDSPTISFVKTAEQVVSLPALPDRSFTTDPIPLSALGATASSGLPITFSSSGACAVGGDSLLMRSAGTCTVTAGQPGDDGWERAESATTAFEIAGLPQEITFPSLDSLAYGEDAGQLKASASSGLPVTYAADGACEIVGGSLAVLASGECVVVATQDGGAGYEPAVPVRRTFTITEAPQTIDFELPDEVMWGSEPIPLLAEATSGLPVQLTAEGGCRVEGSELVLESIGRCLVTATQSGDAGTAAAPTVTREIVVSRREQAIVFPPLDDVVLGAPPVPLQASATSGRPVSYTAEGVCVVLDGILTASSTGDCVITASERGGDGWAAAAPVSRTLTVGRGAQAIDFTPPSVALVGSPPIELEVASTSGLPVSLRAEGTCAVEGSQLVVDEGGVCAITAEQPGDERYEPAVPVTRNIEVIAPLAGELELLGEVATSSPGTFVASGAVVHSLLDIGRRPREVYAIALQAGQELSVTVGSDGHDQSLALRFPKLDDPSAPAEWLTLDGTFVAPVSGIFEISVDDESDGSGAYLYTVSFDVSGSGPDAMPADGAPIAGAVDLAGRVPTSPPGILVEPGAAVTSVLDGAHRPEEYYQVELAIGDVLEVTFADAEGPCTSTCAVEIAYPGEADDSEDAVWTRVDGPWLASESGTYTVRVRAFSQDRGPQRYTLQFEVSG